MNMKINPKSINQYIKTNKNAEFKQKRNPKNINDTFENSSAKPKNIEIKLQKPFKVTQASNGIVKSAFDALLFARNSLDSLNENSSLNDIARVKNNFKSAQKYLASLPETELKQINILIAEFQYIVKNPQHMDTKSLLAQEAFTMSLNKQSFNGTMDFQIGHLNTEKDLAYLAAEFFFETMKIDTQGEFYKKLPITIREPESLASFWVAQKNWAKSLVYEFFTTIVDFSVGASGVYKSNPFENYTPQSGIYNSLLTAAMVTNTPKDFLNDVIHQGVTEFKAQVYTAQNSDNWIEDWMANQNIGLSLVGGLKSLKRFGGKIKSIDFLGHQNFKGMAVQVVDGNGKIKTIQLPALNDSFFLKMEGEVTSIGNQQWRPNKNLMVHSDYELRNRDVINRPGTPNFKKRVFRMSNEERRAHRVHIKNGKLYYANGKSVKAGPHLFVIDTKGNLLMRAVDPENSPTLKGFDPALDDFKHSSFFEPFRKKQMTDKEIEQKGDSEQVMGGGHINVLENGYIEDINNGTGHFQTPNEKLAKSIKLLADKGFKFFITDKRTKLSDEWNETGITTSIHPHEPIQIGQRMAIRDETTSGMSINEFLEVFGINIIQSPNNTWIQQ